MKYAALAALLFAAPAYADDCQDLEKLTRDYRLYVMGAYEMLNACEGDMSEPCELARSVDKLVQKDGKPMGAGDTFLMNLRAELCP